MTNKYVYPYSLKEAVLRNERDLWRESYRSNCACARAIEKAISENYDGMYLSDGCAKAIIEEYSYKRTALVLANTIQEGEHDGRYSLSNKEWAKGIYVPDDDHRSEFYVRSHPVIVNEFTNEYRKEWDGLGLFSLDDCIDDNLDYTDRVLVLKPDAIKDEYKKPEFQIFYAIGGFGCDPTAMGTKVFGRFLIDGEKTSFNRSDFFGVIRDDLIPSWARDKISETSSEQDEQEGIELK